MNEIVTFRIEKREIIDSQHHSVKVFGKYVKEWSQCNPGSYHSVTAMISVYDTSTHEKPMSDAEHQT